MISVKTFLPVVVIVIFQINIIEQPRVGSIFVAFLKVIPMNDISAMNITCFHHEISHLEILVATPRVQATVRKTML